MHKNDNNEQSPEHTETDEDGDSDQESDAETRLGFQRTVEVPLGNRSVPEAKKRPNDAIAADKECKKVASN